MTSEQTPSNRSDFRYYMVVTVTITANTDTLEKSWIFSLTKERVSKK